MGDKPALFNYALCLLCVWATTFLVVDGLFDVSLLPGGTASQAINRIYLAHPWFRHAYWAAALFMDWHFFDSGAVVSR